MKIKVDQNNKKTIRKTNINIMGALPLLLYRKIYQMGFKKLKKCIQLIIL